MKRQFIHQLYTTTNTGFLHLISMPIPALISIVCMLILNKIYHVYSSKKILLLRNNFTLTSQPGKQIYAQNQQCKHKEKILVPLLLSLNIFYTYFKCSYCWLWIGKFCQYRRSAEPLDTAKKMKFSIKDFFS